MKRMKHFMFLLVVGVVSWHIDLCADFTEQEMLMDGALSQAPLVIVPCGRGVDSTTLHNIREVTSNVVEFVQHTNTLDGYSSSLDRKRMFQVIRGVDISRFGESTNRSDYADVAMFGEAVRSFVNVAVWDDFESSLNTLIWFYDNAMRIAITPSCMRSEFGRPRWQFYRQGQSDGRLKMLRSWADEGEAFREKVRSYLLSQWQHVIGQPEVKSALSRLPVEKKKNVQREIDGVTDRIRKLTFPQNVQGEQTVVAATNAIMKAAP